MARLSAASSGLVLAAVFLGFGVPAIHAQPTNLRLEYRKTDGGTYSAFLINQRASAVTAYIAEASYQEGLRERHTALGGDTLGFTNGQDAELPPRSQTDTGRPLPRNAVAGATRILAAIYSDGQTEGSDQVVAMLIAGRHRAFADLTECLPAVTKAAGGSMNTEALAAVFTKMQARDVAEGASLDEMEDAPGRMRYRYFLSAVPAQALQSLQSAADPKRLLAELTEWHKRLAASKPDVK